MSTNVPPLVLSDGGYVAPAASDVVAGVEADFNAAFGGNLSFGNGAPETQLANSIAAIVGAKDDQFLALANGIDPSYASGRMQDAIGRLYFMSRIAAEATVLQIVCSGAVGVNIPQGALLIDQATGYQYACTTPGAIGAGGTVTLPFANTLAGPYAVPATLGIYQTIPGWDSVAVSSGVVGSAVESRAAFETRRLNSVAGNSIQTLAAVRAAVLSVPGVLSCYTGENYNSYPIALSPAATATASISGTTLTVSGSPSGAIATGQTVSGPGVAVGTTISSGSGSTWTISPSQTVSSATLQFGGVVINPNKIYVCVSGGTSSAVAAAIWSKKPPGCGCVGGTTVTVYDTSPPYPAPGVPYSVTYQTASNLSLYFNVSLSNNSAIPANALQLIQAAILAAFSGADGGNAVQIGFPVLVSRFYAGIASLGAWAQILSIGVGTASNTATAQSQAVRADQMPTTVAANIALTLV